MKIELTHDIIAEKVWERLPEMDKQLRQIERLLRDRYLAYKQGKGSPLGEKELTSWEFYFPRLVIEPELRDFIEESRQLVDEEKQRKKDQERRERELIEAKLEVEQKVKKRQRWIILLLLLMLVGTGVAIIFIRDKSKALEERNKALAEGEQKIKDQKDALAANNEQLSVLAGDLLKATYETNIIEAKTYIDRFDYLSAADTLEKILQLLEENPEFKSKIDSGGKTAKSLLARCLERSQVQGDCDRRFRNARTAITEKKFIDAKRIYENAFAKCSVYRPDAIKRWIGEVESMGERYYLREAERYYRPNSGNKVAIERALRFFENAQSINDDHDAEIENKIKICRDILENWNG